MSGIYGAVDAFAQNYVEHNKLSLEGFSRNLAYNTLLAPFSLAGENVIGNVLDIRAGGIKIKDRVIGALNKFVAHIGKNKPKEVLEKAVRGFVDNIPASVIRKLNDPSFLLLERIVKGHSLNESELNHISQKMEEFIIEAVDLTHRA